MRPPMALCAICRRPVLLGIDQLENGELCHASCKSARHDDGARTAAGRVLIRKRPASPRNRAPAR